MRRYVSAALVVALAALVVHEVDVYALRIYFYDYEARVHPQETVDKVVASEPAGCKRLRGPIGAEDAVVFDGDIILMGELDAAVHEFTNLKDHGADASTAPSGKIWAMDRLQADKPRLTALVAPLPEGVTKMHTHGLALNADVLYAANHAFAGGGERVERWRVTRRSDNDDGPPVVLTHLGAITASAEDQESGAPAWTFSEKLNGAINGITPDGDRNQPGDDGGIFLTQFLEGPAHMAGSGSGEATPPEEALAAKLRGAADALGVRPDMTSVLFRRLYKTRIWHCVGGGGVCHAVGPPSTKWNGIEFKPAAAAAAAMAGSAAGGEPSADSSPRGQLYANDIFRRMTVEFDVFGTGVATRLVQRRTFRHRVCVDNLRLDSSGEVLWVGAVAHTMPNFQQGINALKANATRAHAAARAAHAPTPRPHTLLRPGADQPPQPPMLGGLLRINLTTGVVSEEIMQATHMASISWGLRVPEQGGRLFMGSPWDDGVLMCP